MSKEELSILRDKLESLEVVLANAAGEWDDLCGRLDGLGSRIDDSSIDDGKRRLTHLEGQLEDGTIWQIEHDIEELQKKLEELSDRLSQEAEVLRKEVNDSSSEHDDRIAETNDKFEEAKKLNDERADEVAKLADKIDKELVAQLRREKNLRADFKLMLRGYASEGDVAREFEAKDRRYEERLESVQRQLNASNSEIAQLQHAVRQPTLVNQVLGCIFGLALIAGSVWLLIKAVNLILGLIR